MVVARPIVRSVVNPFAIMTLRGNFMKKSPIKPTTERAPRKAYTTKKV
jgi:hypothetical protein